MATCWNREALPELDLDRHQLTHVLPGASEGLTPLRMLNLRYDWLTPLDVGIYKGLTAAPKVWLFDENDIAKLVSSCNSGLTG